MDKRYELCRRMHAAGLRPPARRKGDLFYRDGGLTVVTLGFCDEEEAIWLPRVGDMIEALGDDLREIWHPDKCCPPNIKPRPEWAVLHNPDRNSHRAHYDLDLWLALCRAWLAIHEQAKPEPVKLPSNAQSWRYFYAAKRPFPRHDQTPPASEPYPWATGIDLTGGLVQVVGLGRDKGYIFRVRAQNNNDSTCILCQAPSGQGQELWFNRDVLRPAPHDYAIGDRVRVVSEAAYRARYLADTLREDGCPAPVGFEGSIDLIGDFAGNNIHIDNARYAWWANPADLLYLPPSPPAAKYSIGDYLGKGQTFGKVREILRDPASGKWRYKVKIAGLSGKPWWDEADVVKLGGAQ